MTALPVEYEVLHYPGDRTAAEDCQPGRLLGVNEVGWPWEVLDAEAETLYCDGRRHGGTCPGHVRTTVHLQTANVEAVQRAMGRVLDPDYAASPAQRRSQAQRKRRRRR